MVIDPQAALTPARATSLPGIQASYRNSFADFVVEEFNTITLSGTGEHVWLKIRKTGSNTSWIADQLAKLAKVKSKDVGFAGLKDRNAVTTQWFSVCLAGKPEPDWSALEGPDLTILENSRHSRKLRRGALQGNRFTVTLREMSGAVGNLHDMLTLIKQQGVPNYFGPQRFGRHASNLTMAEKLFNRQLQRCKRAQRSIYLSAARSLLFNRLLQQRVRDGSWHRALLGDVMMKDGSHACFLHDGTDPDIAQRTTALEIHPTGILWGEGELMTGGEVARLEQSIIDAEPVYRDGLVAARVEMQRRALRTALTDLAWDRQDDVLILSFSLPAGSYATAVLNELGVMRDVSVCA